MRSQSGGHISGAFLALLLTGCSTATLHAPNPTATLTPTLVSVSTLRENAPPPTTTAPHEPEIATLEHFTEPEPVAPATPPPTQHTVQAGDTLLALALHYGAPIAAIQLHSGLGASTLLRVEETLVIPPAEDWIGSSPFWTLYEVQSGDTLTGIAARYGVDAIALYNINAAYTDTNLDILSIGAWLILPLDVPVEVAAAPRAPSATPIPSTPAPTTALAQETTVALPNAPAAESSPAPTLTAPAAPTLPPLPPPSGNIAAWPYEVFQLVNAERAAAGLPLYTYNETLALSARLHGEDCRQRGSCSHTGSDGASIKERILRVGYPAAGWAECYVSSNSPAQAVHWWMDEVPPNDWHRRTLLSTWVTEIGIAIIPIPGREGAYYFIANFGRPQ